MKKTFSLVVFLVSTMVIQAQNVGIGTTSPTSQLHTTGTVRHALLSGAGIRPVFADDNGNLLVNMPPLPASSATNSAAQAIPDISCTGVISVNTLASLPTSIQSSSIKVTINITHSKLSDLSIYLNGPDGSIINLTAPSAALAGANFVNTVFTDAGAALSSGTAPFTGSFKPLSNMTPSICGVTPTVATFSAIGGGSMNPNGSWTLKVIDNTAANTGTLNSWTIAVTSATGIDGIWNLKGNSGTNAFNFIGTTDDAALRFRVRNVNAGFIDSASNNTAIGYRALDSVVTAKYNTAFGNDVLKRNKDGAYNVGIGTAALKNHITGDNNTVVGSFALYFNTSTGRDNAVLGVAAMLNSTSASYNTAVGSSTLTQLQSGSYNTAVGYQALLGINAYASVAVGTSALGSSTQANYLVAVGDSALYNNVGNLNTAVGSKALFTNTSGSNNTAQGFHALYANNIGNWNTAVGTNALSMNSNGFNNTSVGSYSLLNNTSGNQNVALGSDALHENINGSLNTAVGLAAMYNNISGYNNTATGYNALAQNTTGFSNTAAGYQTLFTNTSGFSNTAVGVGALFKNTTVSNLVAVGDSALFNTGFNPLNQQDGSKNTGLGSKAMYSNTTGQSSTAAGYRALYNNTSGSSNTAVGINALNTNSTGSSNTAIGAGADIFNGAFSNATAIGAGAIAPASNSIQLGNTSVTNIYTSSNSNLWVGNLYAKGNGMVRNTSSLQLKMSRGSYVVSGNIGALSTIQIPFNFNETFSTAPVVYVGNITGGPGGFAELIMTIANVTTTGGTLFVSNPRNTTLVPNFTVNIVAIGGE